MHIIEQPTRRANILPLRICPKARHRCRHCHSRASIRQGGKNSRPGPGQVMDFSSAVNSVHRTANGEPNELSQASNF